MHWLFLPDCNWLFSPDSEWLISPDANNKKGSESAMGEIAKEIQLNKEFMVEKQVFEESRDPEKMELPGIKPKSELTPEQANAIYEKIVNDAYLSDNDSEQNGENIEDEDLYDQIYDCDIDDFTFEDLDLDEESLEKILKYFDSDTWKRLDIDDKEKVIQVFGDYLAKILDLKNPPKVIFIDGPQYYCGGYSRSGNTITINRNTIDDPKMTINTIAHEMRHAYQHQCAENPQTRKDELYAINLENYIKPVLVDGKWTMFEEYESQLVEAEASAFGRLFEEKVGGK